jgi:GNAT superfamily N-acetyltransferase
VSRGARVAGPGEAAEVARLLVAFRDHSRRATPSDEAFLASVRRLVDDPDTEFLLAGEPAAAVAQLRFRHSVWTSAPDAWLEDLFVAAPARRAGLGEALLTLALERARARGARRLELDANEGNDPALALYARHGLSPRSKGGPGRDLLLGRRL